MTKHIEGNAVDYTLQDGNSILLHCCNAQGVFNAGIAKEIRKKVPSAYANYMKDYELGCVTYSDCGSICNMVAQEYYGGFRGVCVDYGVLEACLQEVVSVYGSYNYIIPYKMCCGLAKGDWNVVLPLCEYILGSDNLTVVKL